MRTDDLGTHRRIVPGSPEHRLQTALVSRLPEGTSVGPGRVEHGLIACDYRLPDGRDGTARLALAIAHQHPGSYDSAARNLVAALY